MSETEQIHLAADISFVHTDHLWRTAGSWVGYPYYGPEYYEDVARIASRGVMDLLFFGDAAETPEIYGGDHEAAVRLGIRWPKHDMFPMVPCMARASSGVGFALTMSTTYHHPFHVARLFSSLDHVTKGRVAWNSITSAYKNEAANWGYDLIPERDQRYDRAREHMAVVLKLWDSVEPGAIVMDREGGVFADPAKVHLINHSGKYYNVRGPLPVIPSPQGRPVEIQAGQSEGGMDLAARYADIQFVSRRTDASIRAHRAELDRLLVQHGRRRATSAACGRMRVQVGESEADAQAKERRFLESLPPEAGLIELSFQYGIDFSVLRGDMKLSETAEAVKAQHVHWGSFEEIVKTEDPDMTVEEFGRGYIAGRSLHVIGTPQDDRRPPGGNSPRRGRQWRLHPRQELRRAGQPARFRRARRARATAPRFDQARLPGQHAA
ncbi:MAG: NtaA/DmoA family FMN-dependent monooxygenase [Pseudomonadota bacterium]